MNDQKGEISPPNQLFKITHLMLPNNEKTTFILQHP